MNLVIDPWLPFKLRSGEEAVLPLNAICSPDVVDFALPRADFQGAAYQFVIGLLQTVFAPKDRFDWKDLYIQPPSAEELQAAFNKAKHAFNVIGEGPLFMQDYDMLNNGLIDDIVKEPLGGAHVNKEEMFATVKNIILENLKELKQLNPIELTKKRIDKYVAMGRYLE